MVKIPPNKTRQGAAPPCPSSPIITLSLRHGYGSGKVPIRSTVAATSPASVARLVWGQRKPEAQAAAAVAVRHVPVMVRSLRV